MPKTFLLGMAQMLVVGGAREENLQRAVAMVEDAAGRGCSAVILPECLDLGWTHPSSRSLAEAIPGAASDQLCDAASRCGIYVVAGLTEREGERTYNTAILISPDGEMLLKHRKINILNIAQDLYSIGDRLGVVHTALGTIGLNICADNFRNSLAIGHVLARMGAQVILSPCAWAVDADHDNQKEPYGEMWRTTYGVLAKLYDVWVVGVSNVGLITGGPWAGRKCIGCSLVVAPGGRVALEGPYGHDAEALLVAEIAPVERSAKGTRIGKWLQKRGYEGP